jgi:uncharacterized cupredoxin-like copper-binding protein
MVCRSAFLRGALFLGCLGIVAQAQPAPAAPAPAEKAARGETGGLGTGDLRILPTRVILEGKDRSTEVMLQNQGKTKATYRIFFKEMGMSPNGRIEDRTKPADEITAVDMIRFAPHEVELAPGETQNVRLQLRKPEGLADGEYRSHLVFQGVPAAEVPHPAGEDGQADRSLSFKITPIFGISIPVIVRHGQCRAEMKVSGLSYTQATEPDASPVLALQLERSGNRSVMGDVQVLVESGGSLKKGTIIAEVKGVAVYVGLAAREVQLPIALGRKGGLKNTRVKVTFTPKDLKADPVSNFLDLTI